jgi:malonyl-CoA O-methyltransferase
MIAAKERIVSAFAGASDYDAFAAVQQQAATALAHKLALLALPESPRILEFGCGTGFLAEAASDAFRGADWLMTDIAPDMVARSRRRLGGSRRYRFAVMDAEEPRLPREEEGFDLVCSSLTVQWFEDLPGSVERLFALVRPGGYLVFSTLAEGTFAEWRSAHDAAALTPGLRKLPRLDALAALRPRGVQGEVTSDIIVRQHDDAHDFIRSLKAIGAATPGAGHRPLGVPAMRAVMKHFEQQGARATYVVATCCFRVADRDSPA